MRNDIPIKINVTIASTDFTDILSQANIIRNLILGTSFYFKLLIAISY